jgi:hypothetical protein
LEALFLVPFGQQAISGSRGASEVAKLFVETAEHRWRELPLEALFLALFGQQAISGSRGASEVAKLFVETPE